MAARRGHTLNRVVDAVVAGTALVISSPLLALGALAVKLEDRGPVLYRQTRVGRYGRDFELFKLRTMVVGAESMGAGYAVSQGDSRITRSGRLLRRLSLDELPQLWNVLLGEMSLVGPRPPIQYEVDAYPARAYRRFAVRPGITGLWQVSGRSDLSWEDSVRLDVYYVENWSLAGDLLILLRTVSAVLSRRGAY